MFKYFYWLLLIDNLIKNTSMLILYFIFKNYFKSLFYLNFYM